MPGSGCTLQSGSLMCASCEVSKYSSSDNAEACVSCRSGYTTSSAGGTSADDCNVTPGYCETLTISGCEDSQPMRMGKFVIDGTCDGKEKYENDKANELYYSSSTLKWVIGLSNGCGVEAGRVVSAGTGAADPLTATGWRCLEWIEWTDADLTVTCTAANCGTNTCAQGSGCNVNTATSPLSGICELCPAHSYNNKNDNNSTCLPCTNGYSTSGIGASTCDVCAPPYTVNEVTRTCR